MKVRYLVAALLFACVSADDRPALAVSGCGTRNFSGTLVYECYDAADSYATFSNNCGTQRLSAEAASHGAVPTDIVPCPRPGGGQSSSGGGTRPYTTQLMDAAKSYFQSGEYTRAAIEYASAERLYRSNGDGANAAIAARNKRMATCYSDIKAWPDSADLLRELHGDRPKMGTLIDANERGVCREFPPATEWLRNRIAALDAKEKAEEDRQRAQQKAIDDQKRAQQEADNRRLAEAKAREDAGRRKEHEEQVATCETAVNDIAARYPAELPPWQAPDADFEVSTPGSEVAALLGQMKGLFDFDWGPMEEDCAKAGLSDRSKALAARRDDFEKRVAARDKTHDVARQNAIDGAAAGRKQESCSAITDKDHPSGGPCEEGKGELLAAREMRKTDPPLAQTRYRQAAQKYNDAHDFRMQIDVLIEAGLPLAEAVAKRVAERSFTPTPSPPLKAAAPASEAIIAHMETDPSRFTLNIGDKMNCEATIRPQINALNEAVTYLIANEPPSSGSKVQVGKCATRLMKFYQAGLTFGPAPGVGLTAVSSQQANHEQRACLTLKADLLAKACKCSEEGQAFSTDPQVQDQMISTFKSVKQIEKRMRDAGVVNPALRKMIEKANNVHDCFNLNSLQVLGNTEAALKRAFGP